VDGARRIEVTLGAHNINQNEATQQDIDASEWSFHPNWKPNLVQNDVGLIKLNKTVTYNGS